MVTWRNQGWRGPVGLVYGMARFEGTATARPQATTGMWYRLASPGTVNITVPTRWQYAGLDPNFATSRIYVNPWFYVDAGFNFVQADFDSRPGSALTGTMFLADASAFAAGVVPTPMQIRASAFFAARLASSTNNGSGTVWSVQYATAPGSVNGEAAWRPVDANPASTTGPYPMEPNKKYWVAMFPTSVANTASAPSAANDIPLGDGNVNGRAIAISTNRTPEAPTIVAPAQTSVTALAGSRFTFSFAPNDPDRIGSFPGDIEIYSFEDLAGVEIQYRAAPTTAEPNPAWSQLPVGNADLSTSPGWWIDQNITQPPNAGVKNFWATGSLPILCATSTQVEAGAARLPAGDWDLRVRTFDYGHPKSGEQGKFTPPLVDLTRTYTPANYPAVNTSPWSSLLRVSISSQVPKPLAVSPINNRAVPESALPLTLAWQYRNTYTPPFPQAKRTVQIRKVGETSWTTLTSGASADASYVVAGYPLVSGNQYEWRVQVEDSSEVVSDWSAPAAFWLVPTPGSGGEIPLPSESIEGATLGCGTYTVEVYRRGGTVPVGTLTGVSELDWGRLRDDMSDAKVVIENWGIDCGNLLRSLQSWAYEIVLWRDNGFDVDRVWEGPITLLTYETDKVTIHAKDVIAYAYRRIIKQEMNDSGKSPTAGRSVVARTVEIIQNAFAPDDPNVLQYLVPRYEDDDAKQYRNTPAYSRTAYEEVDDMAANAGLDYTAVGRSIIVWGTKHRIGTLPEFTDDDLGSSPIVSEYGMSFANRYAVSDGNGVWGEATRLDENGHDPDYGLVEMLSSTWASDTEDETGTYTEAGLAKVRASFAQSSERSIADRYPPPVVVRVPDNTRLQPDAPISIQHLVPGVVIPLRSDKTLRPVVASQKLDAVKCVVKAGEETISVTMSPFSRDDAQAEGEGA